MNAVPRLERRSLRALIACCGVACALTACKGRIDPSYVPATGGDARRGADAIRSFRCGACHDIPGIRAANGVVGPPLGSLSRRTFIAGQLPNTPDNLVRWIVDPPAVEPNTAMPALGVSPDQARDIAAYLYTL